MMLWFQILPLRKRLTILNTIKELNLGDFNPEKSMIKENFKYKWYHKEKVSGFDNIMKLHDSYVADG